MMRGVHWKYFSVILGEENLLLETSAAKSAAKGITAMKVPSLFHAAHPKVSELFKRGSRTALLLALLPLPTLAADDLDLATGGNALVCFNDPQITRQVSRARERISDTDLPHITSIRLLDLIEANRPYLDEAGRQHPAKILLPQATENGSQYVRRIANRFQATMPGLRTAILAGLESFSKGRTRVLDAPLGRVYDTGDIPVVDPRLCVIATVAEQVDAIGTGERELHIDGRLFDHPKHSAASRAMLMLHESILSWATSEYHHTTSYGARGLLTVLIRSELDRKDVVQALIYNGFGRTMDVFENAWLPSPLYTSAEVGILLGKELKNHRDHLLRTAYVREGVTSCSTEIPVECPALDQFRQRVWKEYERLQDLQKESENLVNTLKSELSNIRDRFNELEMILKQGRTRTGERARRRDRRAAENEMPRVRSALKSITAQLEDARAAKAKADQELTRVARQVQSPEGNDPRIEIITRSVEQGLQAYLVKVTDEKLPWITSVSREQWLKENAEIWANELRSMLHRVIEPRRALETLLIPLSVRID